MIPKYSGFDRYAETFLTHPKLNRLRKQFRVKWCECWSAELLNEPKSGEIRKVSSFSFRSWHTYIRAYSPIRSPSPPLAPFLFAPQHFITFIMVQISFCCAFSKRVSFYTNGICTQHLQIRKTPFFLFVDSTHSWNFGKHQKCRMVPPHHAIGYYFCKLDYNVMFLMGSNCIRFRLLTWI